MEALEWALEQKKAVVCMPTGTGKTLVAGLWAKRLIREGLARKIVFLEPTRFLVEQVARYLREVLGLPAAPLHGSLPRNLRRRAWSARIVVATPEIIVSEWPVFLEQGFDAVVVDECHHTTGQDPYKKIMAEYSFRYRLGLSALIPPSRRREIEGLIGEIRCWGWDHPSIRKYMPVWVSEVYESPLNGAERRVYDFMEELWERSDGSDKTLLGNALRWFARDGPEALRETYSRSEKVRRLLSGIEELLFSERVRPAHKLEALHRVLRDHEGYEKAIIFVDRVVIARIISESLRGSVQLLGRRHISPAEALERARLPGVRHIISTSAGEEGIDLPEADLLVLWSNTASPLRFVQRLGRVLRPWRGRQKYVVFIVTPDTVDVDSLLDGLMMAEKSGVHVNISPSTVRWLISLSRRRKILEILSHTPAPIDIIARALGAPMQRIEAGLRWLLRRGLAGYIYTGIGKVYFSQENVNPVRERYAEYLRPEPVRATVTVVCGREEVTMRNASYRRVRTRIGVLWERCPSIGPVRASVFLEAGGMLRMINRIYSFIVTAREVLDIVVDNIYATPKTLL